jgi:hypothetical protein
MAILFVFNEMQAKISSMDHKSGMIKVVAMRAVERRV